ncbi:hypothetical protein MGMO_164c00180 [Methyloglobulus morosus KoM1]|uniref:Uncharacterized protein n=1 Tax=Methyloglobulus morosus KoM1 TaxID=1116472 RepID=V5BSD3_9GAMM|nr:hypothetical protein MGMO_164c00180 [Methyloglobulus morosus KoM1]
MSKSHPFLSLFDLLILFNHLGIKLEQLFQPFGVVSEAAADVDAFQHFIIAFVRLPQVGGHVVGSYRSAMVAGKCASLASRMFSAQRVRSALFLSVSVGTGKLFHPIVPLYDKSVRILTQTVAIQTQ